MNDHRLPEHMTPQRDFLPPRPMAPMQRLDAPTVRPRAPNPAPPPLQPTEQHLLEQLERIVSSDQPIPKVGIDAANTMKNAYETVAHDIERLAQEQVDRAAELHEQAKAFAKIVRESGAILCDQIEQEAKRGYQISSVMRSASMLMKHNETRNQS